MQTVSQQAARKRTYLDPIHNDIVLDHRDPADRLIIDLIDTPEFQRLRRVHQLGVSFFTFQGAEGSRFTHSVGVMHVASKLIELVEERTPSILKYRRLIMASALLHDIGHGPYSHVTEKILGYDHEDWSCRVISENTTVNRVLREHDPELPEQITRVLKKKFEPHYITHMVSSQLDCDRMDYLLRDSHQTGTAYGLFALHRILSSLEIDEDHDRILVVGEKGQMAVEDYLFSRYSMYAQVYYHRKNLSARALLAKIIKRAKSLTDKVGFMDEQTNRWLRGEHLDVNEYLFLDDVQMTYHIKRWTQDKDKVLSDLSGRFLNRMLFNTLRLTVDDPASLAEIEKRVKAIVAEHGLDPEYYVSIESTGLRPYDYYRPDTAHPQTNIMIRTEDGDVRELSTISQTVEALVKGSFDTKWLIYPPEARDAVMSYMGRVS
jgi:HD superfamily phosphohydrolase